jgi:alkanesulfonate monooxygenase SsuD/methylene tetrahydromethanopterin reductase-like flavin-dependent oxidoreductase (luciferase family)
MGSAVPEGDPAPSRSSREAEEAGWDGVFYDAICLGEVETYAPWVVMAATALETEHVRLGAMVIESSLVAAERAPRTAPPYRVGATTHRASKRR